MNVANKMKPTQSTRRPRVTSARMVAEPAEAIPARATKPDAGAAPLPLVGALLLAAAALVLLVSVEARAETPLIDLSSSLVAAS